MAKLAYEKKFPVVTHSRYEQHNWVLPDGRQLKIEEIRTTKKPGGGSTRIAVTRLGRERRVMAYGRLSHAHNNLKGKKQANYMQAVWDESEHIEVAGDPVVHGKRKPRVKKDLATVVRDVELDEILQSIELVEEKEDSFGYGKIMAMANFARELEANNQLRDIWELLYPKR